MPEKVVPWTVADILYACLSWVGLIILLFAGVRLFGLAVDSSYIAVIGQASLLLPVWYFSIYKYGASWQDLGLRRFNPGFVLVGIGLMIPLGVMMLLYAALLAQFDMQAQPGIEDIFDGTAYPMLLIFGAVVVAPFVEELFFRGFVLEVTHQRWGWGWGIGLSSLLFALAHVMPTSYIPIFLLGAMFALLVKLSNSVWPSIIIHAMNNAVAMVQVYAMSQQ